MAKPIFNAPPEHALIISLLKGNTETLTKKREELYNYLNEARLIETKGRNFKLWPSSFDSLRKLAERFELELDTPGENASEIEKKLLRIQVEHRSKRTEALSLLDGRELLHHKTYKALVSRHSKGSLDNAHIPLTTDEVLRCRGEMLIERGDRWEKMFSLDGSDEHLISERSLLKCKFSTPVPYLITVENLGYIDLPLHPDILWIHCPGNNYSLAIRLLKMLNGKWLHFPDYDQNGIDIAQRMARELGKGDNLFIPSWLLDVFAEYTLPVSERKNAWDSGTKAQYSKLAPLIENNTWIEQETLFLYRPLIEEILSVMRAQSGDELDRC